MNLYLIPGLGFDRRIFKKLNLSVFDPKYLDWIKPIEHEGISEYAKRMADRINTTAGEVVLVGHSLGGIISMEIAKHIEVEKIILISSIQSRRELPLQFKIIKLLCLHKIFNKKLITQSHKYWAKGYGYTTQEDQNLFIDMISNQSDEYLQWALKALANWQTPAFPPHTELIQIHGDSDKTFPLKLIKNPTHIVDDGGHFMVYNESEKTRSILVQILEAKG